MQLYVGMVSFTNEKENSYHFILQLGLKILIILIIYIQKLILQNSYNLILLYVAFKWGQWSNNLRPYTALLMQISIPQQ